MLEGEVEVERALLDLRVAPRHQDPLDPSRPADTRRRGTAQLLDQAVVATPARDARLRPEGVAGELEQRARVVIQTAHERRVDLVRNARPLQHLADLCEVRGVLLTEPLEQDRRVGHDRLRRGIGGVERAQRVQLDPLAHLWREATRVRPQIGRELLAIGGADVRAAEAREA